MGWKRKLKVLLTIKGLYLKDSVFQLADCNYLLVLVSEIRKISIQWVHNDKVVHKITEELLSPTIVFHGQDHLIVNQMKVLSLLVPLNELLRRQLRIVEFRVKKVLKIILHDFIDI